MGPVVHPELIVLGRERLVNLTVLGSAIVAEPDIKASVVKLQRQRDTLDVGPEPAPL